MLENKKGLNIGSAVINLELLHFTYKKHIIIENSNVGCQ